MRPNILNHRTHYWASFAVALPLLVMIVSGLLLQSKKHWAWVQPPEIRGTGSIPAIDLEGILASVRQVPDPGVEGWDDVQRLDVRPGRGLVKMNEHLQRPRQRFRLLLPAATPIVTQSRTINRVNHLQQVAAALTVRAARGRDVCWNS